MLDFRSAVVLWNVCYFLSGIIIGTLGTVCFLGLNLYQVWVNTVKMWRDEKDVTITYHKGTEIILPEYFKTDIELGLTKDDCK